MRTCARVLCVITVLATPAAAQSTTEDGIRAMVRGEYREAARILRPLADDRRQPDGVAQFFLAILYDAGQGVGFDQGRACALFLRSARGTHPFSEQAATLGAIMQARLGGAASVLCVVADESWQGGPPQVFAIGPGHQIAFADTSITVTYGDQEQRTPLIVHPGAVYLPVEYTPLEVTRPVVSRRHFFQWFGWMPDAESNPSSWTLGWMLSEVVGGKWIPITGEKSLAVIKGSSRPASYDVASRVRLRVNADGEAEFAILGGAGARSEVIPWHGSR